MKTCIQILGVMAIATSLTFAEGDKKGRRKPGGPGKRPDPEQIFKKLDADSSGSVSLEEFKAGRKAQKNPEMAEKVFKKIDADSSGDLTLEEFKNFKPGKGRPDKGGGEEAPTVE